jgi:hypothetical protein
LPFWIQIRIANLAIAAQNLRAAAKNLTVAMQNLTVAAQNQRDAAQIPTTGAQQVQKNCRVPSSILACLLISCWRSRFMFTSRFPHS